MLPMPKMYNVCQVPTVDYIEFEKLGVPSCQMKVRMSKHECHVTTSGEVGLAWCGFT